MHRVRHGKLSVQQRFHSPVRGSTAVFRPEHVTVSIVTVAHLLQDGERGVADRVSVFTAGLHSDRGIATSRLSISISRQCSPMRGWQIVAVDAGIQPVGSSKNVAW
jgi:hypothetical protein